MGTFLVEASWQRTQPCYVLAPQCPLDMNWQSRHPFDMPMMLEALIDDVFRDNSIDANRIYLIGFSMGAYGCWHIGARAPDRFAAMLPVAGGGDPNDGVRLVNLPVWAIHGDQDFTVPLQQSEEMIAAVQEAGGNVRLTVLRDTGHDSWSVVQDRPHDYLNWLFSQTRADSGN